MSLDSSDSHSAIEKRPQPWVYLFVHRMRVDMISQKLSSQFETFVHKSIVCQRSGRRIVKREQPTISGLIFVRGEAEEVQAFLSDRFSHARLVYDFANHRVAQIADQEMRQFMQLAGLESRTVRFLLHPLGYYASGHRRIRITSGDLQGCEGYIIRIARDRRLVTTIGNMTVAIGGVNKDSFENAEEYVRESKALSGDAPLAGLALTPVQTEVDSCFFAPADEIDILALAKVADMWLGRARSAYAAHSYGQAIEICLTLIEEIGARLPRRSYSGPEAPFYGLCRQADAMLSEVAAALPEADKADAQVARDSLMLRYPDIFAAAEKDS